MPTRISPDNAHARSRIMDEDGFFTAKESWIRFLHRLCVAVKITDDKVMVRDTKDKGKTTLEFSHAE